MLVLLGLLSLYWHGLDSLKKLGHEVMTYDMIENSSGNIEAIVKLVMTENPELVAVDGCFPLRAAAIGRALAERGVKCVPILLSKDMEKLRRKTREGEVQFINRPIVDMLIEAFGGNEYGGLDAFDKRGEVTDLQPVLERMGL